MRSQARLSPRAKRIEAVQQNRIRLDPKGYFLIRTNKGTIEVGFCKKDNVIDKVIVGKRAEDIYKTIIDKKMVSDAIHAAYIGKELAKAEAAIRHKLRYVQDEPL